jgi:hypothetical protein
MPPRRRGQRLPRPTPLCADRAPSGPNSCRRRRSSDSAGYRPPGGAIGELRAAAPDGLRFELRTATTFGRSRPLATVTTDAPLTADQTDTLRFNPWTTGPGIRPSGWLNLLRDAAYRASQRGPEHVGFL